MTQKTTEIFDRKGETNMAMPFRPLSTEKLKIYFKKVVDANCRLEDVNSCRKKHSGKNNRIKLSCPARILKTWMQREINH
jgi:hypothetical protein